MKLILESQFLAPIEVFALMSRAEKIIIEKHENYQKRSYRNRCEILSSTGVLMISIPLRKGKNKQQNIRNVEIAYDQNWTSNFRNRIQSAYGKSPYFPYYADKLFELIQAGKTSLYELNNSMLSHILTLLHWEKDVLETDSYRESYAEGYFDYRAKFKPLRRNGSVQFDSQYHYPQVFESKFGFTPNLSILDLLFNMGPESSIILENIGDKGFNL